MSSSWLRDPFGRSDKRTSLHPPGLPLWFPAEEPKPEHHHAARMEDRGYLAKKGELTKTENQESCMEAVELLFLPLLH